MVPTHESEPARSGWRNQRHAVDNAREGDPAVLPLLAFAVPFLAQWFDREPLQPYEARSASGTWVLEVHPTDPAGKGPMRARILHGAEVSWSGQFAWTFEKAGVSEDGT